jgi:hypothetical protein
MFWSLALLLLLLLPRCVRYREQRDITQPESLNLFLETRFEQLKTACELQMWAEAFRSVEDIQALIALGKRQPKQQMMATYYRCGGCGSCSCRCVVAGIGGWVLAATY